VLIGGEKGEIYKMLTEFLASKNNRFCRWLNKVFRHCEIHPGCKIPKSIRFGHGGHGIVIGNCEIGEDVIIMHNTTLCNDFTSKDEKKKGFPKIGNKVIIGTGSILIGDIKIGNNSIIGAGSFIDKNVPKDSIAFCKRNLVIKKRKS